MMDNETYHNETNKIDFDRRRPHWFDKWINPTTVFALIGGIIWGVQLNMAVLNHSEDISKLDKRAIALETMAANLDRSATKTSAVMNQILVQLEDIKTTLRRNEESNQIYKTDVLINKERLRKIIQDHESLMNHKNERDHK